LVQIQCRNKCQNFRRSYHTSIVSFAVPKSQISHARKRRKLAFRFMTPVVHIQTCSNCGAIKFWRNVCKCGWLNGKPISNLAIKKDKMKKQRIENEALQKKEMENTNS